MPALLWFTNSFSSVQFSCSVMSDSSWPHELQHARPPCPSPTPGVYSNSCPLSWWCHTAISSSAIPFSSCPQPLPASRSCTMSQLFTWGGQSIGVSASAPVFPMNTRDWSPLDILIIFYRLLPTPRCCPVHRCGLDCKNRKWKVTWNRLVWSQSTKWSRAKANRIYQENALVITNTLSQQHKRILYT